MSVNSPLHFERFVHDANKYFKDLTDKIGPADHINRVFILWRAVMHTVRDRIHMGESLDLISQLPMLLKGFYIENWKYHEHAPLKYETTEEMTGHVKNLQSRYGEDEFDWDISTEELIRAILNSLRQYLSDSQINHLRGQLPEEVKSIFK